MDMAVGHVPGLLLKQSVTNTRSHTHTDRQIDRHIDSLTGFQLFDSSKPQVAVISIHVPVIHFQVYISDIPETNYTTHITHTTYFLIFFLNLNVKIVINM